MDTTQIDRILSADDVARKIVRGVVPKDGLPNEIAAYPVAYVCNTHRGEDPGQHWISIFVDAERKEEYFDSYGLPPQHGEFETFLRDNCSEWMFNENRLQSPLSNVCGQYCTVYLLHRCRGIPMKLFVKTFGSDLVYNDCRVFDFIQLYNGV